MRNVATISHVIKDLTILTYGLIVGEKVLLVASGRIILAKMTVIIALLKLLLIPEISPSFISVGISLELSFILHLLSKPLVVTFFKVLLISSNLSCTLTTSALHPLLKKANWSNEQPTFCIVRISGLVVKVKFIHVYFFFSTILNNRDVLKDKVS